MGGPTLNNELYPRLADALIYIKGLKPKGLIGAAFGSFGWSGEAVEKIEAILKETGVELVGDSVGTKYAPNQDAYQKCYDMGLAVAKRL